MFPAHSISSCLQTLQFRINRKSIEKIPQHNETDLSFSVTQVQSTLIQHGDITCYSHISQTPVSFSLSVI